MADDIPLNFTDEELNLTMVRRFDQKQLHRLALGYPDWAAFVVGTLLATLLLWTIVSNAIIILVIVKSSRLRTVPHILIGQLAVTDFFLAVGVETLSLLNDVSGQWHLGMVMCNFWLSVDVLCCTASIWSLVMIAWDRYTATRFPYWYRDQQTNRRAYLYIALTWLLSAAISLGPFVGMHDMSLNYKHQNITVDDYDTHDIYQCILFSGVSYVIYSASGSFVLPCIVLLFLYVRIFYILTKDPSRSRLANQLAKHEAAMTGIMGIVGVMNSRPRRSFRAHTDAIKRSLSKRLSGRKASVQQAEPTESTENAEEALFINNIGRKEVDYPVVNAEGQQIDDSTSGVGESQESSSQAMLIPAVTVPPISITGATYDNANTTHFGQQFNWAFIDDESTGSINSTLSKQWSRGQSWKRRFWSWKRQPSSLLRRIRAPRLPQTRTTSRDSTGTSRGSTPSIGNIHSLGFSINNTQVTGVLNTLNTSFEKTVNEEQQPQTLGVEMNNIKLLKKASAPMLKNRTEAINVPAHNRTREPSPSLPNERTATVKFSVAFEGRLNTPSPISSPEKSMTTLQVPCLSQENLHPTNETPRMVKRPSWLERPPKLLNALRTNARRRGSMWHFNQREKEATKRMFLIISSFLVCWLPFFSLYITRSLYEWEDTPASIHIMTFVIWLGYSNSGLNPILYTAFNNEFKVALKAFLFQRNHRKRPRVISKLIRTGRHSQRSVVYSSRYVSD